MPLNEVNLGAEIKTAIESAYGKPADDPAMLKKFSDAIALAVVNHIKTNGLVTIGPATVTTGAGSGGVVTGTGTIS